jgi:hypothetical protein
MRRGQASVIPNVRLPVRPLQTALVVRYDPEGFDSCGYTAARLAGIRRRRWAQYRATGVPLWSADKIAVRRLGMHPAAIWGHDWFAAGGHRDSLVEIASTWGDRINPEQIESLRRLESSEGPLNQAGEVFDIEGPDGDD